MLTKFESDTLWASIMRLRNALEFEMGATVVQDRALEIIDYLDSITRPHSGCPAGHYTTTVKSDISFGTDYYPCGCHFPQDLINYKVDGPNG